MNQKGVFFTLMVLFLVLGVIGLNFVIEDIKRTEQETSEANKLISVENKFNNIVRNSVNLKIPETNKKVIERTLPFNYALNSDSLRIEQQLPISKKKVDYYLDLMNTYCLFAKEHLSEGYIVDINIAKNLEWNGTAKEIAFLIEPFCYQYQYNWVLNEAEFNPLQLPETEKCLGSFDFANHIRRFDVEIKIGNSSKYFDEIICNGAVCQYNAFDPLDPLPYFSVTIDDSDCLQCNFSPGLPRNSLGFIVAGGHFALNEEKKIEVKCINLPPLCPAEPTEIIIFANKAGNEENLLIKHDSPPEARIDLNATVTFKQQIEGFSFFDVNATVKTKDNSIIKTNNPSELS